MSDIYVTAQAHFDSAHYLPGYEGKCANMHGHRWVIQATFGPWDPGELDECGIATDFGVIKKHLKAFVDIFDHKVLNDVGITQPTAENVAIKLKEFLEVYIVRIHEIKVFESPDCYVTVKDV